MANLFFYHFDRASATGTPSPLPGKILYRTYNNLPTISAITIVKILTINPAYKYTIVSFHSYTILLYIVGAPSAQDEGIVKDGGSMEGGEVCGSICEPISFQYFKYYIFLLPYRYIQKSKSFFKCCCFVYCIVNRWCR
jgi:hypothetical protein